MKNIILSVVLIGNAAGLLSAAEYETDKMESGISFSEQRIDARLNNSNAPVEICGDFKKAETAAYTAPAKNFLKPDAKAPPTLKDPAATQTSKTAEQIGSVIGTCAGTFAGTFYGMTIAGSSMGLLLLPAVAGAAAGAAIGYGVVVGARYLRNKFKD